MLTVIHTISSRTPRDKTQSSLHRHNRFTPERARLAEALSELHNLLEEYAPAWYTEEHHRKAEVALQSSEKI